MSKVLHEGVIYRHIILTVPAMFRTTFSHNAAVLLSGLMRCGGQCLDDFYSAVRGKALRGGYITVLHTHGRNGQYHPHLHVIATSGGLDGSGECWEHLQYLPYGPAGAFEQKVTVLNSGRSLTRTRGRKAKACCSRFWMV